MIQKYKKDYLGTAIHEIVAVLWVELGSSNNFCQLLHICRLYVNNICNERKKKKLRITTLSMQSTKLKSVDYYVCLLKRSGNAY